MKRVNNHFFALYLQLPSPQSVLSYRCSPIHPDDDTLLIGRHFPIDVDTLLNEEQHGHGCHEGEDGVQDDTKDIQLWREKLNDNK